jgi:hypothetical protein
MTGTTDVRLFVASPSDVGDERIQLGEVVKELNLTLGPALGFKLELVGWETHVHPSMGSIQPNINRQIGDYDILVGIMWNRFGTRTETAGSGTEEEFRLAYDKWNRDGKPHIMFYFCKAPASFTSPEEAEQKQNVLRFRDEISQKGLVSEYENRAAFAGLVRLHLGRLLNEMFSEKQLRALSDRREAPAADREKYDAAFGALFEAARMTKAYLKKIDEKEPEPPPCEPNPERVFTNTELAAAWSEAYELLKEAGERGLAKRCLVKSFCWEDGALWENPEFMKMPIDVDAVLAEGVRRWGLHDSDD